MTRVAAIDCGTNSLRLLIADVSAETGRLHDLERTMEIVRLGEGVDRTGRFAAQALERTFTVCRRYAELIKAHDVRRVRFVATSASRDVANRDEFSRGVQDILGVSPEVISGDQEAAFSFTGATRSLAGRPDLPGPYLVVDIGGGSTEFVLGERDRVRAARSVDIGCVRMTERHLLRDGVVTDPPERGLVKALRADVEAALDLAAETVPLSEAGTFVGLAGSVITVAGIALGLPAYDASATHHARVSRDKVAEITHWLLTATHAERAAIPVMHPGRVDVIASGALILLAIMERSGADEVVVSEHDILDGLAFKAAEDAG